MSWGLALPLLAWALIRIGGLERGWPLVQMVAFTPYALVCSLLALLAVVLLRRWIPTLFVAIAIVGFVLAVGPRGFGSPEPIGHGRPVRILAVNLELGRADPGELLSLAAARDADLLVLTELTSEAESGLTTAAIDRFYPERRVSPAPGTSGTGIWSRWPLAGVARLDIRQAQIVTTVQVPDSIPFDLVAVHPTAPAGPRSTSEWAADFDRMPAAGSHALPLVLAGDFNATLDHVRLRQLIETGYRDAGATTGKGLASTWPARIGWPPPIAIDRVLAERGIGISEYDVERVTGSDHRAVFAELVMPPVP